MPGTPSSLRRGRKQVRAAGHPRLAARDGTMEGELS
jgi:hypothetical protein